MSRFDAMGVAAFGILCEVLGIVVLTAGVSGTTRAQFLGGMFTTVILLVGFVALRKVFKFSPPPEPTKAAGDDGLADEEPYEPREYPDYP